MSIHLVIRQPFHEVNISTFITTHQVAALVIDCGKKTECCNWSWAEQLANLKNTGIYNFAMHVSVVSLTGIIGVYYLKNHK